MKILEALDIIRFNTSTQNDLSSKNINDLFTDRNIVRQFKYALDKYARATKAIEDIFSFPLENNAEFVDVPPLALRSESYKMIYVWLSGVKYLMSNPGLLERNTYFSYQTINGIPVWFVPWNDKAYISPSTSTNYSTTTLNGALTATDTTITLTDGSSFLQRDGRITIGSEKISYVSRNGNVLSNCTRGVEQTTAATHDDLTAVSENNMWLFYRRLHTTITDNKATWDNDLEIPDEHVEMITDYTTYKLLSKIDGSRAAFYKINFDEWLRKTAISINKGRTAIHKTGSVRNPFAWEG